MSPRLSRRAFLGWAAGLGFAAAGALVYGISRNGDGERLLRIENDAISLDLDPDSGAILQVTNRRRGLDLVDPS